MANNRNNANRSHYQNVSRSKKKRKRRRSAKDKLIMVLSVLLIVCSAIAVTVVAVLNGKFFSGDDLVNSEAQTPVAIKDKVVNFLIVGIDDEEGRGLGQRSDVLMVANYNIEENKVNVLQFPRDTFIGFEESSSGKINAIYGLEKNGGVDGLSKKLHEAFTLNIDHYVTIKMDGFKDLVDSIGGVTMDVPISFNLDGVTIEKGVQTLNGLQAEMVVRERHSYALQDIGRLQTQRIFIAALLQKMLSLPKTQLVGLVPTPVSYTHLDVYKRQQQRQKEINELEGSNSELLARFNAVGELISSKKVERAELRKEIEALHEFIERLEARKVDSSNAIGELKHQIEELKKKNEALAHEITELEQQSAQRTQEADGLSHQIAEALARREQYEGCLLYTSRCV